MVRRESTTNRVGIGVSIGTGRNEWKVTSQLVTETNKLLKKHLNHIYNIVGGCRATTTTDKRTWRNKSERQA